MKNVNNTYSFKINNTKNTKFKTEVKIKASSLFQKEISTE